MKTSARLIAALVLAAAMPVLAWAQADDGPNGFGHWEGITPAGVRQSASVTPSQNGVTVGIGVNGDNPGSQGSSGSPGNRIVETPRSGSIGGGGQSSGQSGGGSSFADWINSLPLSNGGQNIIVNNLPTSTEFGGANGAITFGGTAIGGWTFDVPVSAPAITTGWAPVSAVPHIDPWAVARAAVAEFPLPGIDLKVNPDPGRVNVDSWFWVQGYDGGTLSHSKTQHASHTECRLLLGVPQCHSVDDSVTVVVHLHPQQYAWTFGDDRDNTATFDSHDGLGRAYTDPNTASPVAHAYHWSSVDQVSQGGYQVTLTVTWSAEFSANGGAFQGMADVQHTWEGRHQVRQVQSVIRE